MIVWLGHPWGACATNGEMLFTAIFWFVIGAGFSMFMHQIYRNS